jgi:hypothetical protein
MSTTKKRSGWWAVLVAAITGVCSVAVVARDNLPPGQVQQAAEKVCAACERAGVLQPDGGVRSPEEGERKVMLVPVGTSFRPVLVPGGHAQPAAKATVEELPEDNTARGGEAPPAFR